MDVFLEDSTATEESSLLSRLAVARPLHASSLEELISESSQLARQQVRYVALRRQQVRWIGEHAVREILDDHGLSVSCLGYAGGFTGELGVSYNAAVNDVQRALDMARELSAAAVVTLPGGRGLHTYRHAERTILDGLSLCARLAQDYQLKLLVPTDTVLAGTRDCFRPRPCFLEWLKQIPAAIFPMIVVRGKSGAWRLPRGWRSGLSNGGCIRICHRCESYERNSQLLSGIIDFLNRGEFGKRHEDLTVG